MERKKFYLKKLKIVQGPNTFYEQKDKTKQN